MENYSQWHTERTPTGKKVNSIEEINTLSDKMDALLELVASKNADINPNDVPLSTLIEQNNDAIDVNFVSRNLLDSTTGGTFMEITLGEAIKFQDNIMANYS